MINQKLEQGTDAWKKWRSNKLGASEAPIIWGTSKFSTPHKLWMEKTGRSEGFKGNWATDRGTRLEPVARARYELKSDLELPAAVFVHPRYKFISASLDGYNEETGVILEIKITGGEVFEAAKRGECHMTYYPQCQQQLMVVPNAKEVHFFCAKVERDRLGNETLVDDALVIVKPDEEFQKQLLLKLIEFYSFLQQDIPPPLTANDWLEADDQSTVLLFGKLKKLKQQIRQKTALILQFEEERKTLAAQLEELRAEVIEHCETEIGHSKIVSVGLKLSKNKNGNWSVYLADEAEGEA